MFELRRLAPEDLGLILELQERIRSGLADKAIFQTSSPEFISYCLAEGGHCYGVSRGGETVAYRMVYFPRDREFNLARDTPLPPAEHLRVAHWDTIAVLPQWRGFQLARLLNTRALADLEQTDIRHLLSTSSPANPHGVRSLIETGFRPVRLVRKFGGKLRFLCYRPSPAGWPAAAGPRRTVALGATEELEQAFRDGWTGTSLVIDDSGPCLALRLQPAPFDVSGAGAVNGGDT
ncbi:GNAT family N-acetyltransferase [Kitasatospora sp. NBC_01302]|uniref:GNAT family N-acetyltransferase n=1 Tax=Kitasatospora sp. NBC_01302 TaxID=2903575 RepID=UPI002E121F58|nr:N-acetyltransferase [Kitasatospora sp. NBC_01302]